ncbi:hypothetical protein Amsp01_086630 [Amycolatopsis sp. NBRC 101858]|uniref:hypothetical protein n=1 Tax=Amycolatopsis sp. NBRC 101858 TaxID=3032200 RepID=UPI0024A28341|nr:hypothetical protein [Amycolatopsis sp. NBRC 101858]GLY42640.1 hypothetical protein Amsp01_086630 [Amycolatopsis sp. NBRC 101858]
MTSSSSDLDRLAVELTEVIDGVAAVFGDAADPTVNGELDCDPTRPGHLLCWQYGVRLEHPGDPETRLTEVIPTLEQQGWQAHDRSTPRELIARFSREGADFTVHVARASHAVAIIGSTRPVPA